MIQIIREGNLKIPVVTFVCSNCECVFKADRESYKQRFTSYNTIISTANCPCCNTDVNYEESL